MRPGRALWKGRARLVLAYGNRSSQHDREYLMPLDLTAVLERPLPPAPVHVRRLPIGAEPQLDGGVHFRVWAPRCRDVSVEIEGLEPAALEAEGGGYFSLWNGAARAGMR